MIEAYLEAYEVIGELYTAEIKKLGGGTMTSDELVVWTARMDAFKEAEHAIFSLMHLQDDKKTADGDTHQRPEK
jgi:hypothetical protein